MQSPPPLILPPTPTTTRDTRKPILDIPMNTATAGLAPKLNYDRCAMEVR